MKLKLLTFITLINICFSSFAAQTTALYWKGIEPSVTPCNSVIITDQNGDNSGNCNTDEFVEGDNEQAIGDVINQVSWAMNSVETIISTSNTLNSVESIIGTTNIQWPFTWAEVLMNGLIMETSKAIIATSGSVTFTTGNKVPMGATLIAGQNIEVHTVISSPKLI